jgi:hypothetical protein
LPTKSNSNTLSNPENEKKNATGSVGDKVREKLEYFKVKQNSAYTKLKGR